MILVIDNYDSFTYNLVQYIGELGYEVVVKRNDEITCEEVKKLNPEKDLVKGDFSFTQLLLLEFYSRRVAADGEHDIYHLKLIEVGACQEANLVRFLSDLNQNECAD